MKEGREEGREEERKKERKEEERKEEGEGEGTEFENVVGLYWPTFLRNGPNGHHHVEKVVAAGDGRGDVGRVPD